MLFFLANRCVFVAGSAYDFFFANRCVFVAGITRFRLNK